MTNSHFLGIVTFGSFAFMALLAWVVSYRYPATAEGTATRGTTRAIALGILVLGAVIGYAAFVIDFRMRMTTLHETMIAGSTGTPSGSLTPMRTVRFTIEHPGIVHELFLSPTSELLQQARSAANLSFSLHGPRGEVVLPKRTERFDVRTGSESERDDWEGKTFPFTPAVAGVHTLQVQPLTVGIPRIQVRIVDPQKRDGQRMSGY